LSNAAGIAAFIATLFVMIVFHEFGHFVAAKRFGIKVEAFFLGFGPRLWSRRRGETEYGFNAIPLGGYVKIAGMNPWQTVPESDRPRTYGAKPAWQRAVLLVAGSATHLVLAAVILWALFGVVGISEPTTTLAAVLNQVDDTPAPARAVGLRAGDRLLAVDGKKATDWQTLSEAIRSRPGQTITLEVERDGLVFNVPVTTVAVEDRDESGRPVTVGQIGIRPEERTVREPPHLAGWSAIKSTFALVVLSARGIGTLFSPEGIATVLASLRGEGERGVDEPIGIVGGARIAGEAASAGALAQLLSFLAGFVVFVGVINLMPLPPLDGGHLLVLAIEKVRRRSVDMRRVVPIAAFVIGVFIFLSVALLYLDIFRPIANPFE
jgi:membrane-associated protease RseP (regulator of RpoE activity)